MPDTNNRMTQIIGSNPLLNLMLEHGINPITGVSPSTTTFQPDLQVPPFPPMPERSPVAGVTQKLKQPAGMPGSTILQSPPKPTPVPTPTRPTGSAPTSTSGQTNNKQEPILRVLSKALHNLTLLLGSNNGQPTK